MKKFVMGFLTAALLFTAIPVGAAIEEYICHKADYKVMVNGAEYISEDLPVLNYKGSTYAPFRSVLEAAGLNVNWNAELKRAEVTVPEGDLMKRGDNVSEIEPTIETYIKDGVEIIKQNEVEYVKARSIRDQFYIVVEGQKRFQFPKCEFDFSWDNNTETLSLYKIEDGRAITLIDSVPYVLFNDTAAYIEFSYYVNTILPLVK